MTGLERHRKVALWPCQEERAHGRETGSTTECGCAYTDPTSPFYQRIKAIEASDTIEEASLDAVIEELYKKQEMEGGLTELRLPAQMKVYVSGKWHRLYLQGENPQQDGTVLYKTVDRDIIVSINPEHKVCFP